MYQETPDKRKYYYSDPLEDNETIERRKYGAILRDLVENPLTLKECIQKWEELGWTWSDDYKYRIKITKLNQEEQMYDNLYIRKDKSSIESDFQIPFDLIPLIYKTIKALEE